MNCDILWVQIQPLNSDGPSLMEMWKLYSFHSSKLLENKKVKILHHANFSN